MVVFSNIVNMKRISVRLGTLGYEFKFSGGHLFRILKFLEFSHNMQSLRDS